VERYAADPLLQVVIVRAGEAGVDAAWREFPVVQKVVEIAAADVVEDVPAAMAALRTVFAEGIGWAGPFLLPAIVALAPVVEAEDRGDLRSMAFQLLIDGHGAEADLVPEAFRLARAEWTDVWEELPRLSDHAGLARAALVVRDHARLFAPDEPLAAWAEELAGLLQARPSATPRRPSTNTAFCSLLRCSPRMRSSRPNSERTPWRN
jgi:hypothetical protein